MHGSRRTRRGPVRIGKTQLFESVRMARVIRGGSLRTRTEAQADGRVSKSGDDLRRGCSGGMEGGAGGGTPFPITRPPSPVRRTHHLKRKSERTQSTPGASAPRHKGSGGLPYPQLPPQARPSPSALPLQGLLPSKSAPARSMQAALCKGEPLRDAPPRGLGRGGSHTLPPPSPLSPTQPSGRRTCRWTWAGGLPAYIPPARGP